MLTPSVLRPAVVVAPPASSGLAVYMDTPASSDARQLPARGGEMRRSSSTEQSPTSRHRRRVPGAGVKFSEPHGPRSRAYHSGALRRRFSSVTCEEDSWPSVRDSVKRISRQIVRDAAKHLYNGNMASVPSGSPSRPPSGRAGTSSTSASKRAKSDGLARALLDSTTRSPAGGSAPGDGNTGDEDVGRMVGGEVAVVREGEEVEAFGGEVGQKHDEEEVTKRGGVGEAPVGNGSDGEAPVGD